MDYRTKATAAAAVLAVLTLTAVLGVVFSQRSVTDRQSQEALAAFQPAEVTGLELSTGVTLKKETQWTLSYQGHPYPASADRVETYLKTLSGQKRERLVTSSGAGTAFGLEKDYKTLKLLGAGGKVLADLQIGSANDLGDQVYVRLAGSKEIWETDRGFARTLDLDFNTWADLSLFPGRKAGDLTRIAFDSKLETADKTVYAPFDLVKSTKDGKAVWENRLGAPTAAAGPWADAVAGFRATGFVEPSAPAVTGAPVGSLRLTWGDGNTSTLTLWAPDAQNRYRGSDGKVEVWIADWALGQLLYK